MGPRPAAIETPSLAVGRELTDYRATRCQVTSGLTSSGVSVNDFRSTIDIDWSLPTTGGTATITD